jgi:diamine N-acetyltransferase
MSNLVMENQIVIRECKQNDIDTLIKIGRETYYETFKIYCSPQIMNEYLEKAFSKTSITSEFENVYSTFFFVYDNNNLAGYFKINTSTAQTDLINENGLEIERIYVEKEHQKRGIGRRIIEFGIEKAKEHKKDFIWLGVWKKNANAITFYEKIGFKMSGTHIFAMSDEEQTDYIMKLKIRESA